MQPLAQLVKTKPGHVYRFEGGDRWTDLGSPDKANAISAMAVYEVNCMLLPRSIAWQDRALAESEY